MALKIILPMLVALIHVYIFALESLLWGHKKTNKIFGVKEEEASITKSFAFNQGFYNLFLAIQIFIGVILYLIDFNYYIAATLISYGLLSVLFAGIVLILSSPKLYRSALIQIVPASFALISFYTS